MGYHSPYKGREIDEAVKRIKEDVPKQLDSIEKQITDLSEQKADTKSIPKKISQLENDLSFITEQQAEELLGENSSGNSGTKCVSGADNLSEIIPADGEQYIIKYEKIPYYDTDGNYKENENPVYVEKIGDGTHNLTELPAIRSIVAGNEGEGSLIQFLESELYEILEEGTENARTPRSIVTGKGSVAFGRYNTVHGRESFATNYNNTVNGKWSAAFNQNNTIEAADSSTGKKSENLFVAGGTNNKISGDQGAVLGSANKSNGYHYVILGDNNILGDSANFVRVLGRGLRSNGAEQILLGTFNAEDNNARVIIASGDSTSNPRNSIVIKKDGRIEFEGNITHQGTMNSSSTITTKALISNTANISDKLIAGTIMSSGGNTVDSPTSFAVGENNTVTSRTSGTVGYKNKVLMSHGFAAGEENEVSGENAYAAAAFGKSNKAHGLYSLVSGVGCKSEAFGSRVEGFSCKTDTRATGSHVGGFNSKASTPFAFVHGLHLKSVESDDGNNSPAIFGRYNKADDALFMVGNGSSDEDRKNAFTVNKDNSITVGDTKITEENLSELLSLETELGVTESDNGASEKMVRRANTAFYADEADIAGSATKDGDGNRISTTYATKAELETAVGDISSALDELHAYAQALVNGGVE